MSAILTMEGVIRCVLISMALFCVSAMLGLSSQVIT